MKSTALRSQVPPMVTTAEVERVIALRESRAAIKRNLERIDSALDQAEQEVIAKIDAEAGVSGCGYHILIKAIEKRFPAWKEHFIHLAGKGAADTILADTPAKTYRTLVIG
jgi:hypothetical protein